MPRTVIFVILVIFMRKVKRRERRAFVFGSYIEIAIIEEYFEYDVVNLKISDVERGFETSNWSVIPDAAAAVNFRPIDTLKRTSWSNPKSQFYACFNFKASINLANIECFSSSEFIWSARPSISRSEAAADLLECLLLHGHQQLFWN